MGIAINNFLLSLAWAIDAQLGGSGMGQPKRSLWVHSANEDLSTAVYSVLRMYGGPAPGAFAGARVPAASVQCDTRGQDPADVLAAAWAIHEALMDAEGRPRMHWTIDGKVMSAAGAIVDDAEGDWEVRAVRFVNAPGIVGRDGDGRHMATFSVDVEFQRA